MGFMFKAELFKFNLSKLKWVRIQPDGLTAGLAGH